MEYPAATLEIAQNYVRQMRTLDKPLNRPEPIMRGQGASILNRLEVEIPKALAIFPALRANAKNQADKDEVEGVLSIEFFRSIEFLHGSPEVLTDRDFWRFLSINYFYEFTEWRERKEEGSPCSLDAFGAMRNNLTRNCPPFRMFQRALLAERISNESGNLDYCRVVGSDLWKSHILGVNLSYSSEISRQLLEYYSSRKVNSLTIRPLAKRLTRLASNVLLDVLDKDDAEQLMSREFDSLNL